MSEPQPWDAVLGGGDSSPPNLDYLVRLGLKKIFKLDDSVIEEILSEEDMKSAYAEWIKLSNTQEENGY